MCKIFLQQFQLSEREIINGVKHWHAFQIGKSDLKVVQCDNDKSKIVVTYSEDVLMTIPDNEEYRILRGLVEMGYTDKLECYFCEVDKDKNFLKNPPKVAVFLKKNENPKSEECARIQRIKKDNSISESMMPH